VAMAVELQGAEAVAQPVAPQAAEAAVVEAEPADGPQAVAGAPQAVARREAAAVEVVQAAWRREVRPSVAASRLSSLVRAGRLAAGPAQQ